MHGSIDNSLSEAGDGKAPWTKPEGCLRKPHNTSEQSATLGCGLPVWKPLSGVHYLGTKALILRYIRKPENHQLSNTSVQSKSATVGHYDLWKGQASMV